MRWFVVVGLALGGCSAYQAQPVLHSTSDASLPTEPAELIRLADDEARLGPSGPNHARSRAAAERALAIESSSAAAWRAARAIYFLAASVDGDEKAELAARCIDVSAVAVRTATSAEPYFYQALCMGARAQAVSVEGLDLVKQMVRAGEAAKRLDPSALHGGADRLLGGVYLRAPAWPASVGDIDAAIEHLERAVELAPDWAENHLLYAEALLSDDRHDEARAALRLAAERIEVPGAEGWREQWRTRLRELRTSLEDSSADRR